MRHDRRLHLLLLAQVAISIVFLQMSSTFGLHVTSSGFAPSVYGLLISLNGVMIVLFELPLTVWTRRRPAPRIIAAGYTLIGLGFAGNAFAHTLPTLLLVVVLFTLGEMIAMPVASAYIADRAPADMRGRYMGGLGLTWAIGLTLGPSLGLKMHAQHPLVLWAGCGLLGLTAAVLVWNSEKKTYPGPSSGYGDD